MPSPVITSHAATASPVNRTRGVEVTAVSIRAGIGHARWGASGVTSGPSRSRMCGRASRSSHSGPMSPTGTFPPRWMPKPMLARRPGSGNDQK